MAYIIPIIVIVISFVFYWGQNKNENIGGKMALCKLFWLDYTLITWFFLPVYFYYRNFNGEAFDILFVLSTSMWIRGLIELFMLYVTKNWTPPLGIAHNIITILLVISAMYFTVLHSKVHLIFSLSLLLSLLLETYYAYAFYKIVKDQTKGDKAIWFASKENPQFAKVLKVTTIGNILCYGGFANFLYFIVL